MTLSQTALQGVLASATANVYLQIVRIEHPDIDDLKLVNDHVDLVRADGTYVAFPFDVKGMAQTDERPPRMRLVFTLVDQRVLIPMRLIAGKRERATLEFEIVLQQTPDTTEFGPITMKIQSVMTDSLASLSLEATFENDLLNRNFPGFLVSPSNAA